MKKLFKVKPPIRLKDFDPGFHDGLEKEATRAKTDEFCRKIGELQKRLYANARQAVLIVLQGMDTSGKDGAGKRVLEYVNPYGIETASFKAPTAEEMAHDFLWRIHKVVPRYGNIGVFNRSHYEDVLIVRVMKLQPDRVWRPRYDRINEFENLLVENNVTVLKFFLHISKEEQAERLNARLETPEKRWKFESADLKMRARWKQFQKAYEEAINQCSTPWAPWHVVPADHKWYRDYIVARTVLDALEKLKLKWPAPREDLSKIRIK
jgi:PPK2 family polyphosphate:nucleotide phosphotransferase